MPGELATGALRDAEVRQALEAALAGVQAPGPRVVEMRRRASPYGSSFPLEEVSVVLGDGAVLDLFVKELSPGSLSPAAAAAKPDFLRNPLREIEVYRRILAPRRLGPACYGVAVDAERGRYWLFLERVSGLELYQVGDPEAWQAAATWLGRLHACFAPGSAQLLDQAPLVVQDEAYFRRWLSRALEFRGQDRRHLELLEAVRACYPGLVRQVFRLPRTFLHGDFYASNVLVDGHGGTARVVPVDWEMAALGPCLMDLAALVAGGWPEADRRSIAAAYFRAFEEAAPGTLDAHDFDEDLARCRLLLAIQWLGWSAGWQPPEGHARDWLAEATELAAKLRLLEGRH